MLVLLAVLIVLCFFAALLYADGNHVHIIRRIERLDMSVQDQINSIVAQLHKAKDEIVAKLEEATAGVQAQLVEAGVAEQVDLSALAGIAQALDDLVPDAVEVAEVEDEDEAFDEAADEAADETDDD